MEREQLMHHWDKWRRYIADGGTGSWPRDAFESLLDYIEELEQQILEAQKYATDAHAGEVRDITPLEALQEQSNYYEDMLDELEKSG